MTPKRYATLLAIRAYSYCVYQTEDGTLWVEAWRSSARVSSAMYAVIGKCTSDDANWVQTPDEAWIRDAVARTLAGTGSNESKAAAEEFADLELEAPRPQS